MPVHRFPMEGKGHCFKNNSPSLYSPQCFHTGTQLLLGRVPRGARAGQTLACSRQFRPAPKTRFADTQGLGQIEREPSALSGFLRYSVLQNKTFRFVIWKRVFACVVLVDCPPEEKISPGCSHHGRFRNPTGPGDWRAGWRIQKLCRGAASATACWIEDMRSVRCFLGKKLLIFQTVP